MAAAIADGVPVSWVADNMGIMLSEQDTWADGRAASSFGAMTVAISTVNPDGTESVASKRADSVAE
ncbi:hypothetical protein GCM10023322_12720 [Rugosimonospora acidiphila]|uniref:Uncharacterized protein n=1 Tax=Rugosimonospora acidiphila TaxID=556531 RepID=A0ABP9RMD4_9ACTN